MKITVYKIKIFLIFCVLTFTGSSFADDFSEAMLDAKANLTQAMSSGDEKELIKVRGQFERIRQLNKDTWLVDYYIALSDYNIAVNATSSENNENVKKYTAAGLERIESSIMMRDDFADAYVLQLMLHFNRWIYEQDKMNDIISASTQAENTAMSTDANNPRLWLVKGISAYYTPDAFGGGVKKSLENLNKSESLFKTRTEPSEIYPDWGKDMLYGYLVLAYLKRNSDGDFEKATEYLNLVNTEFPESGFIKGMVMKEYEKAGK